jgi:hypothetical protein
MVYQLISIAGAIMILGTYTAHQAKRLNHETVAYQVLNMLGGACLTIAAVAAAQYGFIMLEGTWTVVSAYGLWRVMSSHA